MAKKVLTGTIELNAVIDGENGDIGYSVVTSVSRDNTFTEAQWATYGTVNHQETWSDTSSIRNGCRIGDIFMVVGRATDTKNTHALYYRSTTASGNLSGVCISHQITPAGESVFVIDLDDEHSSVALNAEGNSISEYNKILNLSAFYGTTNVLSACTVVESHSDSDIVVTTTNVKNTGQISIHIEEDTTLAAQNDITFTVTHPTYGTKSIVFTLTCIRAGANGVTPVIHELAPSVNQIVFSKAADGLSLTPNSVTVHVNVKKIEGNSESIIATPAGYSVRYSFMQTPSSSNNAIGSNGLEVSKDTTYGMLYLGLFNGTTLVDKETIPILKDGINGTNGSPGSPGSAGNGVSSITRYFGLSVKSTGIVANDASATWSANTLLTPTEDLPYLWSYETITYTQTSATNTQPEVVAIYNPGANLNLLRGATFGDMKLWDRRSEYQFVDFPSGSTNQSDTIQYYLSTSISSPTGGSWQDTQPSGTGYMWKRIKRTYTLDGDDVTVYMDYDTGLGINGQGKVVSGLQNQSAYRDFVTNNSLIVYKDVLRQIIHDSSEENHQLEASSWYTLSFYAKGTGTLYTYIYDNDYIVDTSYPIYVDGVAVTSYNQDLVRTWTLAAQWAKHTLTFRTKNTLPSTQKLLFRLMRGANEVYLCMPKLERGMIATSFQANTRETDHGGYVLNGNWLPNEKYQWGCGRRDVVILNGVKKRVKNHGEFISNLTFDNDEAARWEDAEEVPFASMELILVNTAYIENLIAYRLQSGLVTQPRIDINGKVMKIFSGLSDAEGFEIPGMRTVVDSRGGVHFRFYDPSQQKETIDISYLGIKNVSEVNERPAVFTEYGQYYHITDTTKTYQQNCELWKENKVMFYTYEQGYELINGQLEGTGDATDEQFLYIEELIGNDDYIVQEGMYITFFAQSCGDNVFLGYRVAVNENGTYTRSSFYHNSTGKKVIRISGSVIGDHNIWVDNRAVNDAILSQFTAQELMAERQMQIAEVSQSPYQGTLAP